MEITTPRLQKISPQCTNQTPNREIPSTTHTNLTHPSTPALQVATPWVIITPGDPECRLLSAMAEDWWFVGEGTDPIRDRRPQKAPLLTPRTRARARHPWLGFASTRLFDLWDGRARGNRGEGMDSGDPAFYVAPNPHRRGDMAPRRLKQPIKPLRGGLE
jgi:hypothetical protein